MSKTIKNVVLLIVILSLIMLNSTIIVTWLNKSLFDDFILNTENVNSSFYNGVSLVFLITVFIYSLIGVLTISILITDILFTLFIIANNVKATERNEFITFSELQTITSPKELLSFVEVSVSTALITTLLVTLGIVLLQWLAIKIGKKTKLLLGGKSRLVIGLISFIAITAIFSQPNYYNHHVLKYKEANLHNHNPLKRARSDGFLPSFMHTVKPDYMEKPNQYDKRNINRIFNDYSEAAVKINKQRNKSLNDDQTILYLSESLMDPGAIPDLLHNETPIPFISRTKEENIGGTIYSQYIGGGTANIEWSILTSFSLEVFRDPISVTPYSDFYGGSKNHHTLLSFYDTDTVAIHPYTAHLYKRKSIYNAIGFDDFLYLNNGIKHTDKLGNHSRVSDEALNKDIQRYLGQSDVGLLHVLTMQNHSPYNEDLPDMVYQPDINLDVFPEENEQGLINYLQGLKASDEAVEDLLKEIDQVESDVNILFYGDHFPSLFRGTEDRFSRKEIHETPWFLYMNHGRSKDGIHLKGLSPAFFTTVLLREGDYYVSPFQALMDQLLAEDIRRIGDDFIITDAGKINDNDLSPEVIQLVNDYRLVVYDSLFGKNKLGDKFFLEKGE